MRNLRPTYEREAILSLCAKMSYDISAKVVFRCVRTPCILIQLYMQFETVSPLNRLFLPHKKKSLNDSRYNYSNALEYFSFRGGQSGHPLCASQRREYLCCIFGMFWGQCPGFSIDDIFLRCGEPLFYQMVPL